MGGNGSYQREFHRIADSKRDFFSLDERIENHKILLPKKNVKHKMIPMNSNSATIYLCANVDKNGFLKITTIAYYHKHKISKTIDLEFDKDGDIIPFRLGKGKYSHAHKWGKMPEGERGRKTHNNSNVFSVDVNKSLIKKIVEFNKSNKKWE